MSAPQRRRAGRGVALAALSTLALAAMPVAAEATSSNASTPVPGGAYKGKAKRGKSVSIALSARAPQGTMRGTISLPCARAKARFETSDGRFTARKRNGNGKTVLRARGRFTAMNAARGKITKVRAGRRCRTGRYSARLTDPAGVRSTTVRYGPVDLDAAGAGMEEATTFNSGNVERPCEGCTLIGIEPRLAYANGKPANMNTGAMLHHVVLLNPPHLDASCSSWPERFFAAGNERTPLVLPNGFGYPVASGDRWRLQAELMNMEPSKQRVYIDAKYYFVEGDTALQPVRPLWLDVNNCKSSQYSIRAGRSDTEWDFTVPAAVSGSLVAVAGHQHDAGVRIETENITKGETICDSRAGYGNNPAYMGAIESMSGCVGNPLARISPGDVLRLHSIYDSPEAKDDVMGIAVAYVAP